jgi:hypothetical protein
MASTLRKWNPRKAVHDERYYYPHERGRHQSEKKLVYDYTGGHYIPIQPSHPQIGACAEAPLPAYGFIHGRDGLFFDICGIFASSILADDLPDSRTK